MISSIKPIGTHHIYKIIKTLRDEFHHQHCKKNRKQCRRYTQRNPFGKRTKKLDSTQNRAKWEVIFLWTQGWVSYGNGGKWESSEIHMWVVAYGDSLEDVTNKHCDC